MSNATKFNFELGHPNRWLIFPVDKFPIEVNYPKPTLEYLRPYPSNISQFPKDIIIAHEISVPSRNGGMVLHLF